MPVSQDLKELPDTVKEQLDYGISVGDITNSEAVAIGTYAMAVVNKKIIEHQEIIEVSLNMADNPQLFEEMLMRVIISILGLDQVSIQKLAGQEVPPEISRQMKELQLAHEKVVGTPTTAQAAYDLGIAAAYQRDSKRALEYFYQAVALDPTMPEALKGIGWLEQVGAMHDLRRHENSKAEEKVRRAEDAAEAVEPQDAQSLSLRGYCAKTKAQIADRRGQPHTKKEQCDLAGELFRSSLALDPNDAGAHNGLGNIYLMQGRYSEAVDSCTKSIAISPNYTFGYHDLAIAYTGILRNEDDNEKSIQLTEKVILAWEQTYELALSDPGADDDLLQDVQSYIRDCKHNLRWLKLLYD